MENFENILKDMEAHGMTLPKKLNRIHIPNAYTTLENAMKYFLQREGREFVKIPQHQEIAEWLTDNKGRGLFLHGDCGLGKSFISRIVIPAIVLKYQAKVFNVYDIGKMNGKLDDALKKVYVVLDDIGTEEVLNDYGTKKYAFAELIDNAEKQGNILIITTNLSPDQLTEKYGERVLERIISTTKRIEFRGKTFRM